jgi:hypothetical protein
MQRTATNYATKDLFILATEVIGNGTKLQTTNFNQYVPGSNPGGLTNKINSVIGLATISAALG